jgi:hypothetical protein
LANQLNQLISVFKDSEPAVALILAVGAALIACLASGFAAGSTWTKYRLSSTTQFERFTKIYAPLRALFIDVHPIVTEGVGAPRFTQRLKIARDLLLDAKYPSKQLKRAFAALIDKRISRSQELDFGTSFPMGQIKECIRSASQFADPTLLRLVRLADAARSEAEELTTEEMDLLEHIYEQHEKLGKRFL